MTGSTRPSTGRWNCGKGALLSEKAADTPEADAGLDGPMERPTDDPDAAPVARKTGTAPKPIAKKPSRQLPAGEVLDLGGATVIAPGQFAGNMTLKNIIIPEGVTEIGDQAFNTCMFLETVVLPKSLRKIGKMAFMSCRSLRQIEIPEGVEQIDTHAFGATNNLKEVHLLDSLKVVDQYIFGMGGDSPYATANMSGKLASRLQAVISDSEHVSAIYARRYVIDGAGYENMYDYDWTEAITDEERIELLIQRGIVESEIEYGRRQLEYLDKNALVTIKDKHFVLAGFDYGSHERRIAKEIEKRGGIVHSTMVKKADYLVIRLKRYNSCDVERTVKKALEWREKGATNLIVSDYQMWQAMLGEKAKKANAKKTDTNEESRKASEPAKKAVKAAASDGLQNVSAVPKPAKAAGQSNSPKTVVAKKPAANMGDRWANLTEDDRRKILKRHLSKNPKIFINNRTFVFCGCGRNILDNNGDSLESTLQCLGGKLGKGVNQGIDYVVIKSPDTNVTLPLRRAIDFIDNGNRYIKIVLLQDLKQTVAQELRRNVDRSILLDIGKEKVIQFKQFAYDKGNLRGKVIIPEGVTEIGETLSFRQR